MAEEKFNEKLIVALETAALSKDTHIKDLQNIISILHNTNSVLQQNVESVNAEIDKLKSFIKEELAKEISKIDSNASKLRYCEDQLQKNNITISEYAAQMEMKETTLNMCQLSLNEAQSVVHEYKDQLENANKTIAENTVKISQIEAQVASKEEALEETEAKLKENQDELKKQKEVIQQKEEKETEMKEQIKEKDQLKALLKLNEESLQNCELSLNKSQNVVKKYIDELQHQNETIAQNFDTISQLNTDIKSKEETLKETEAKLKENQDELKKQKEVIQQKEEKETELKEQIRKLEEKPTSCTSFSDSNVHYIKIPNFKVFPVLCNSEIAGPGWTVIQQRINGRREFFRDWETYKNGFGDFTGDFFLGLEKIHRLTKHKPHELYIHMEAFKVKNYKRLSFYARYDNFSIAGEDDKYRLLSLGTYSGDAEYDQMRHHERQQFSTFDSDNDAWNGRNCAKDLRAGWWYKDCMSCHLNGKYYQREVDNRDSNWWHLFYSLKTIKMLIRPRDN